MAGCYNFDSTLGVNPPRATMAALLRRARAWGKVRGLHGRLAVAVYAGRVTHLAPNSPYWVHCYNIGSQPRYQ